MRKLKKNANNDFRVKAYAGTNGMLLAFDLDPGRRTGKQSGSTSRRSCARR